MTASSRRSPAKAACTPTRPAAASGSSSGARSARGDGTRRQLHRRGYRGKGDALTAMREALSASARGTFTEPSRQPLSEYLETWLAGLRLAPSTVASYRKNIRLHVQPHIGSMPLASLTTVRLTALYRQLEKSGRKDHRAGEGLSARTIRYLHDHHSAFGEAVKTGCSPQPCRRGQPPSGRGEGAGDAPVGRRPAGRIPGMGRGRRAELPAVAHCWP